MPTISSTIKKRGGAEVLTKTKKKKKKKQELLELKRKQMSLLLWYDHVGKKFEWINKYIRINKGV